jgi:hypothetical protein
MLQIYGRVTIQLDLSLRAKLSHKISKDENFLTLFLVSENRNKRSLANGISQLERVGYPEAKDTPQSRGAVDRGSNPIRLRFFAVRRSEKQKNHRQFKCTNRQVYGLHWYMYRLVL